MLLFPPGNTCYTQQLFAMRARKYADASCFLKDEALYSPVVQVQVWDFFTTIRADRVVFNFFRFFHFDHLFLGKAQSSSL
jgi:hypothetical protein